MLQRRSLGWPITLGVVLIVLIVALGIGWVLLGVAAAELSAYFWAVLAVGAALFVLVLVGVVTYLLISVKEIRLNQRQSNFIDSVTHELKSPIASLKLYLQTLARRSVTEAQQADFYRFMLEDVERLDTLINQLLDAARLDQSPAAEEMVDVDLSAVLHRCADLACKQHSLTPQTIELILAPLVVRGRPIDVEVIFRNLIDNAVKYAGDPPQVSVRSSLDARSRVVVRVTDNGAGVPPMLRRKIFGRFVRLGDELERAQLGTGLGLYIVRTLVGRLRGRIQVRNRGARPGTVFEVELPGRAVGGQESAA